MCLKFENLLEVQNFLWSFGCAYLTNATKRECAVKLQWHKIYCKLTEVYMRSLDEADKCFYAWSQVSFTSLELQIYFVWVFLRQHSRTNLFTTLLLNHNISVQLNFIRCKHFVCLPDLMLVSWTETLWFRKKGQQQYFTGSVSVLCVWEILCFTGSVSVCVCVINFVFVCTHYS